MNHPDKRNHTEKYLQLCEYPAIQALRPTHAYTDEVWRPTADELLQLLNEKLPYPDRSNLRQTTDGWEYDTYFREWAEDYGTYIDTHRQFFAPDTETVLLLALSACLGIDGKWMV